MAWLTFLAPSAWGGKAQSQGGDDPRVKALAGWARPLLRSAVDARSPPACTVVGRAAHCPHSHFQIFDPLLPTHYYHHQRPSCQAVLACRCEKNKRKILRTDVFSERNFHDLNGCSE